jgi:hypothetical protein
MNGTVQVIGTGGVERSDHMAIAALELHIHGWRAGLGCRFGSTVIPGAIFNDVDYRCIVNQVQAAALADSDGGLREVGVIHMHVGAATTARTPTRDNQSRDKAQYYEADYKLFHGYLFLSFFGKNVIEYTNPRMPGLFLCIGEPPNTSASLYATTYIVKREIQEKNYDAIIA